MAGDRIAPDSGEREKCDDLFIRPRLLDAFGRLNADVSILFLQQAVAH